MKTRLLLSLFLSATLAMVAGCSDDDDDPVDPGTPEDPYVGSVMVDPSAHIFEALGEDTRFAASALDQSGAPIDTVFAWWSTDEDVVVVNQDGLALATGLGTAMVIATAGAAADTAEVTVSLGGSPSHEWIAGGNGNWNEPSNWSTAKVPGEGDTAVIGEDGTYTVTLEGPVQVANLILGGGNGIQTLATGANNLTVDGGGLLPGGLFTVDSQLGITGEFILTGGDIEGAGLVTLVGGSELHVVGNPVNLRADVDNRGTIVSHPGTSLRIEGDLDNTTAGLFELRGDAYVVAQLGGTVVNRGSIIKSTGEEEASIVVSSSLDSDFNSNGSITIEMGTLGISGGTLRGRIDIEAGASLLQTGNTRLPNLNSQGDGVFVAAGRLDVGTDPSQVISIRHLVLDSWRTPSISGAAGLLVDETFAWRSGTIADLGSFTTQVNSETTIESRESKILARTNWRINGTVAADGDLDLSVYDGAIVSVENNGTWVQNGGGRIAPFSGAPATFEVFGSLTKIGEGNFIVDTKFTCSGHMDLREGLFIANGDFLLWDTGVITGGGVGNPGENIRLNLINAASTDLRGTLAPGLDDGYALFEIQGRPTMTETFTIELDVIIPGDFNTESVTFLSSGVEFGGTLAFKAKDLSQPGVDYQMIRSHVASGTFAITGDEQFDEVVQDGDGVVGRRFQ